MALPTLIARTRDGRIKSDRSTRAALFFRRGDFGGAGTPQEQFVDEPRLAWPGREGMLFSLAGGLVGLDNYAPTITIEGTRVWCRYPVAGTAQGFQRPVASVLISSF